MISDVKRGLKADLNFELGQPFRPYQQLMGVLPDRSKKIVPTIYHDLMTSPESPIIDFYPRDFDLDMNGKKMEWEAVVKAGTASAVPKAHKEPSARPAVGHLRPGGGSRGPTAQA